MTDVGVRVARRGDVDAVTNTQIRAWRSGYGFLPEGPLEQMSGEGARELWRRQWEEAIVAPPTPRHRLLVAVERGPDEAPDDGGGAGDSGDQVDTGDTGDTRDTRGAEGTGAGPWRERVVGLATHAPAEDPDLDPTKYAELLTLLVDPDHVRRGHGSRLLNATVDHLREDGFAAVVTWVFADHLPMLAFLESAGWATDEAERVLDMGRPIRMVRLATDIS